MKNNTILKLLNNQRKNYAEKQKFHFLTFAAYSLILLLDFILIVYTKAISLDAYAWAGIIFLFVLCVVEAKQYYDFKSLKENVDLFYLKGEYKNKR